MSTTQKPEALRLADKYEIEGFLQDHRFAQDHWCRQAAAELRRQHARIEELEAQLAATQSAAQGWKLAPVGWQFYEDGKWWNGDDRSKDHRKNTEEARYPIRDVYAVEQQSAPPEAAPLQMPKPVGWFHRHPNERKNGEVCNYQIAPADKKDVWEEFPLHTEQQVRTLLAGVSAPAQKGWCDGCSPDNCCGCGPAVPAKYREQP